MTAPTTDARLRALWRAVSRWAALADRAEQHYRLVQTRPWLIEPQHALEQRAWRARADLVVRAANTPEELWPEAVWLFLKFGQYLLPTNLLVLAIRTNLMAYGLALAKAGWVKEGGPDEER
jgi:hypothetical protein